MGLSHGLTSMVLLGFYLSRSCYFSSLLIFFLIYQGLLAEAESVFTKMKMTGFYPDVIAYTTMIHAYNIAGSSQNFDRVT